MVDYVWVEVKADRRCEATRGPRSTVRCERVPNHGEFHAGRGRVGQWFFWEVEDVFD